MRKPRGKPRPIGWEGLIMASKYQLEHARTPDRRYVLLRAIDLFRTFLRDGVAPVAVLLLALLAGALQTSAQTQTTLTGTIVDPNGVPYSGARVTVSLVAGGPGTPTYTPCNNPGAGCQFVLPGPTTANAAGAFSITEWATSSILPAGSTYTIGVDESGVPLPFGTGAQRCQITGVTFAAATFDVSAVLSAACPALTLPFGAGSGSVSIVSCGNYPLLFTCTVTNPTTNPVLNFFGTNAPGGPVVLGNPTTAAALPIYFPLPSAGCGFGVTPVTASYTVQASDDCHDVDLTGTNSAQTVTLPQPGSNGTATFIQATSNTACGGGSSCTTPSQTVTVGHAEIVFVTVEGNGVTGINTPTDTAGDTFVGIPATALSPQAASFQEMFFVLHSIGGAMTVTATSTGGAPNLFHVDWGDFANVVVPAPDQQAGQSGGIGQGISSPAVTTTYPIELLMAGIAQACGAPATPGGGYQAIVAGEFLWQQVPVTGSYVGNLAATCNAAARWSASIATFPLNGLAPEFTNGFWLQISNHSNQTWAVQTSGATILACDGTSAASTTVLDDTGIWFESDGTNWRTVCGQGGGGGPGTGTQFALADWATTSTLGSIVGAVTGDSLIANNGAAPAFAPPGVPGSTVSSSPYTVKCDSGTTLLDRRTEITFQAGASAITMPDPTDSGCGQNFVVGLLDDNAGTLTVTRETAATFTVFNGSTATDGATSFTLSSGEYATVNSPDNANWTVRIVAGGGGGGGTIGGTTSATFVPFTTSADTLADSAFSYLTSMCSPTDSFSTACITATHMGEGTVTIGTDEISIINTADDNSQCELRDSSVGCSHVSSPLETFKLNYYELELTDATGQFTDIFAGSLEMNDAAGHNTVFLTDAGNLVLGFNGDVGGLLELFDGGVTGGVTLSTGGGAGTDPNTLLLNLGGQNQALGTGVTTPTDLEGALTAAAGTASYTFVGVYTNPPVCLVQDQTTIASLLTVTVTNTTLTATTTGATDQVKYHCFVTN